MTAEVLAAARGTLRDLDAALAAHEAAQAVAWLDDAFDRLQSIPCKCGCGRPLDPTSVIAGSTDAEILQYAAVVSNASNAQRPMAQVIVPPGAYEDHGELIWPEHPTYDSASWPHPFGCEDVEADENWEPPSQRQPEPAPTDPAPDRAQQRYTFVVGVSLTAASVTGA